MRSIGPMELLVILGIAVLLFGGKKIPEVAKGLGEGIRNFKTALKVTTKKSKRRSRRKLRGNAALWANSSRLILIENPAVSAAGFFFWNPVYWNTTSYLGRHDRVFRGLGHAKLHDLLGRNFDRFARRRVAPRAGFPVDANKPSDPREHKYAVLFDFRQSPYWKAVQETAERPYC